MADQLTDDELQQLMAVQPRAFDSTQLQPVIAPPNTQPDPSMPPIQAPDAQQPQATPQVAIAPPPTVQAQQRQFTPVSMPTQPETSPSVSISAPKPAPTRGVALPIAPGATAVPPLQIAGPSTLAASGPKGITLPTPQQTDASASPVAVASPSAPMRVGPSPVTLPAKLAKDQAEQARLESTGSGEHQLLQKPGFWHKVGGIAARVGDIGLTTLFPSVAAQIPGTELHHRVLLAQQRGVVANDLEQQEKQQQIAGQEATVEAQRQNNALVPYTDPITGQTVQVRQSDLPKLHTASITAQGRVRTGAERAEERLAEAGLKHDDDGNIVPVEDDKLPPKLKADIAYRKVREDLMGTQQELAEAKTATEKAKNDPNSAAYQLAIRRLAVAQQNAGAAQTRATAYMGNYLQMAYNKGMDGKMLPGTPVIQNDAGEQVGVGSRNASTAIANQANAAQFNDVYGATDNMENAAKALVAKKGKGALNDARVGAALADPETTSHQWAQGMFANSGLTQEQRNYVIGIKAYRENLQALRKSAGGSVSDSQVDRLVSMAPGAQTPDLDYLLRQTAQIRGLADRLGKGATVAQGGLSVQGQGTANQNTRPPASRPPVTQPPPRPAGAVGIQKYASGKSYYVDGKGNKLGPAY